MAKESAVMCWSGGKDSALCLQRAREDYRVEALVTTVNREYRRVSMHGVREELVVAQAEAIGIPPAIVHLDNPSTNRHYQEVLGAKLLEFQAQGIGTVIFGDIFLEDVRRWREKHVESLGMKALFPLWQENTPELIDRFIAQNYQAMVCCVSDAFLTEENVGVPLDRQFIESLPDQVDPCGENGEFHSFVFDGPIFAHPVPFTIGERVYRPIQAKDGSCPVSDSPRPESGRANGLWFADLLPG